MSGRMIVTILPGALPTLVQTLRAWVAMAPNRQVVLEPLGSGSGVFRESLDWQARERLGWQDLAKGLRERLDWQGDSRLLIVLDGLDVRLVPDGAPAEGVSVAVPTSPLPIWAGPQAVALAAWLTAFLTLIAVILAAAMLAHDQGPTPAPVQIVIVTPDNTGP